jgi:hypothetical protein
MFLYHCPQAEPLLLPGQTQNQATPKASVRHNRLNKISYKRSSVTPVLDPTQISSSPLIQQAVLSPTRLRHLEEIAVRGYYSELRSLGTRMGLGYVVHWKGHSPEPSDVIYDHHALLRFNPPYLTT